MQQPVPCVLQLGSVAVANDSECGADILEACILNERKMCGIGKLKGGLKEEILTLAIQLEDAGGAEAGSTVRVVGHLIGTTNEKDETGKYKEHLAILSRVVSAK